jgi:hypothetical protein
MKLSKGSRPSPALVLAALALVFAMVGTAIAGPDAISNKITKPKVKKIAKKQINKAAPTLSVAEAERADRAQNANNADNADRADSAETADRADNVLFAVVDNPAGDGNATLQRSYPDNVTLTDGLYVQVNFGRDVSNCAWTATKGNHVPGAGTTALSGFAQTHGGNNANEVSVATRTDAGTLVDDDFHLVVVC